MPLTRVTRVPFGKIPAATDVEPRQAILSQAPAALESAAQKEQNAALVQFRAAGAVGDVSREIAQMGVQYLKPLDDLTKSRKVLEANDVAIGAILQGRRMADAAKTDGTPHTEYVQAVGQGWERISENAKHAVRHLGPAAVAHVSEALGTEKLRQYTNAQQYFFERETSEQKGSLERFSTYMRQEITSTVSPAERVALQARFDQEFDTAADMGVITRSDAEKSKSAFHLHTVEATAIQLGRATKSVEAARSYLRSANITPQQEKDMENAVYDDLWYDEHQEDRRERVAAKEISKAQEYLAYTYVNEINSRSTTPPKLEALKRDAAAAAKRGDLTGDQARQIDTWATQRIEDLLNPRPPRDDETAKQAIVNAIQRSPETVTVEMIMEMPGLLADTRNALGNQLKETQDKNHFRNDPYFKMKVSELERLRGEAKKEDDNDWGGQITGGGAEEKVTDPSLSARIGEMITAYYEMLEKETRSTHGRATREQIKKYDDQIEVWKEQLRTTPKDAVPKNKPSGATVNDFNDLKNAPKQPK